MKRLILLTLLCALQPLLRAQTVEEQRSMVSEAESAYAIGRFSRVRELLGDGKAALLNSNLRQNAYRLLSLSALGEDKEAEAEIHAAALLRENPYFTSSLGDPQRFVDMIESLKGGMGATITTASSQAENLSESPVPVVLITGQMIRDSGARNLAELLTAYVPGMTLVDCNQDINIAMRSIYSSGQEKILFMLNGHRINSYATNIASPDFSISLEKVRQIEVLRGPASSLYGGVALTAVVNIITRQGADVDGLVAKVGGGNYGQRKGDVIFGKRYFDIDILAWGSIYRAEGQKYYVPLEQTGLQTTDGDVIIGGVGNKPSYDAGLTLKWGGFSFLYDTHFSQLVSPYTIGYTFSPYRYSDYATYRGQRPGYSTYSHHANLQYQKNFGKLFLAAEFSYDDSDMTHYDVISDMPVEHLSRVIGSDPSMDAVLSSYPALYRYHDGQEKAYGARVKGDWSYISSEDHKGLLSFGAEYNRFDLTDSRYLLGAGFNTAIMESTEVPVVAKGSENNKDVYVQLKHTWRNVIFNAGLRYDIKERYNGSRIHQLSPRVALIYLRSAWNAKLSYSRSFVDAPYFYRKTNLVIAQSGEDLSEETINSLQATFQAVSPLPGLNVELNAFYNHAENLIYPNGWHHQNAGSFKGVGLEILASYKRGPFDGHIAFEVPKTLRSTFYGVRLDKMYNVPEYALSTVLALQVNKSLRLHTHVGTSGAQTMYIVNMDTSLMSERRIAPRTVVDLGANYGLGRLTFGLNVYNLFDKHYRQGGLNSYPVQQPGRWFLLDVAIRL